MSQNFVSGCESFGAMIKKIIKHLTCRRSVKVDSTTGDASTTPHHVSGEERWRQTFTRGFIQQAFERVCVRAELRLGPENAPFAQRTDVRGLQTTGRASAARGVNTPVFSGPWESVHNLVVKLESHPEPEDI